jgi:hypothetical protein
MKRTFALLALAAFAIAGNADGYIWKGYNWSADLSQDQTPEEAPVISKIESWGWKYLGKHLGTDGETMRWEFMDPDPKNRHHGIPVIVDVIQLCTPDQFAAAGTAAEDEASVVYNWLKEEGKLDLTD